MHPSQKTLRIDNPCPMTLARVSSSDGTFYCDNCQNSIIDFRDKSNDEIIQLISSKKACGIFNDDQLVQPQYSLLYKIRFAVLTLVAVLGFNVHPIQAQVSNLDSCTYDPGYTVKSNTEETQQTERVKLHKPKKRKIFRRRRRVYRTMGCIEF